MMSSRQICVRSTTTDSDSIMSVRHFNGQDFISLTQIAAIVDQGVQYERDSLRVFSLKGEAQQRHTIPLEIKSAIDNAIVAYRDRLMTINDQIFATPEMGNEEYFASQWIVSLLRDEGFDVIEGLCGRYPLTDAEVHLSTAFKAIKKGKPGGSTIAIMLEYDALPMGHACGHNLIATSGLTAALALGKMMTNIEGEIWVIGTPAEEGGRLGGKIPLLKSGHFNHADVVMITHPGDRWDTGSDFLAISGARITFEGVPSHAAAAPEKGASALDAAILTYQAIEMCREHIRDDARIHGIIKEGGIASNIVPEKATMSYAVRALDQPYVEYLKSKIESCVLAGAIATGAKSSIQWTFGYSAPIKVPILDDFVINLVKEHNIGQVSKWEALGSSDLGNVGYELPTVNLWFKIAENGILPHTHEFMRAAGSPDGFNAAIAAGNILASAGWYLFQNPSFVKRIKESFVLQKLNLTSMHCLGQ